MNVIYDEPALVVNVPNKTRQLFPLSRVSRVLVSGHAEWSMGALFACANAGVSVLFLDATGEICGRWLGRSCQNYNFLQSLFQLLDNPAALPRYQNWRAGVERMAARSAAKRLAFKDWQTADLNELQVWSKQNLSTDWQQIQVWLQNVVFSSVMQYLQSFGLDANNEFSANTRINLTDDLVRLLSLDFLPALTNWQKKYHAVPEQNELLFLFEQRSHRLEHLLRGALNKLHQSLLELR